MEIKTKTDIIHKETIKDLLYKKAKLGSHDSDKHLSRDLKQTRSSEKKNRNDLHCIRMSIYITVDDHSYSCSSVRSDTDGNTSRGHCVPSQPTGVTEQY